MQLYPNLYHQPTSNQITNNLHITINHLIKTNQKRGKLWNPQIRDPESAQTLEMQKTPEPAITG
jgi:hypothetical protein